MRARVGVAFVGSVAVAAVTLWACSSDTASSSSSGGTTSTTATSTTTATPPATPPAPPPAPADAGSDCGKAPTLHPGGDGGVYCPFSATGGGKNLYCTLSQQCCETPANSGSPSTCQTTGTACPVSGSTVWECGGPKDCTGGKVCCAHGGDGGTVTVGNDTCGPYLSHFGGTTCETTCAAGQLVVCEQQGDCTSGTCTAVKPKGNDIGVCN